MSIYINICIYTHIRGYTRICTLCVIHLYILNMHTYFKLIIAGRDFCEIRCSDWVFFLFKWLSVAPKFCWCGTEFFTAMNIRWLSIYLYTYAYIVFMGKLKTFTRLGLRRNINIFFSAFNKSLWLLYRYNLWYLNLYN